MHQLRYAYNTNGCAHHRLPDALRLISEAGYDGVALTLDWHHLDPTAPDWQERTAEVKKLLDRYGLASVIETGARYLLDPAQKHEPTLVSTTAEGRAGRVSFLKRAIDVGRILGSETVSFWAGISDSTLSPATRKLVPHSVGTTTQNYLTEGLNEVIAHATKVGQDISFEPEPGMAIETNADYENLLATLENPDKLNLALDLGHVWVTGEGDPAAAIRTYADRLGTISIEGMNRGVHLHLPLDQGDMEIPPLIEALQAIKFNRLVCVELSRESPRAHLAIPESIRILQAIEATTPKD
ncbi:sugar phosphate isomerase/epimerase family protein [Neolewinella antarctica]|uniref:Sugar phosphate isomerase/epimerase n=1 Tax=Neolewinella antarctica TaxID=442734 RepID=A0ABX0XFR7_9BACT|nr:sugar phosphate isomerase/epimerase family protein [Neolewinella antarctica]NJC28163.1 sugar phosphate isomerase/epimerase [Neolewinella antarctica]